MRALMFSFAVLLLLSANLHADPRQWDTTGVVILQGDYLEWEQVTARNEQGNVLVVWLSFASGDGDLWAQVIGPDGIPQWVDGGVMVCGDPETQARPAAVAVDDGWIIAWLDYRTTLGIRAQKLNNAGQKQWSSDNYTGVQVDGDIANVCALPPRIIADHQGGAIVVWEASVGSWNGVYAQRISGDGTLRWDMPVVVATHYCSSSDLAVTDDGDGNLLIAAQGSNDNHIVASIFSSDGAQLWSGVVATRAACGEYVWLKLCKDGEGGGYVCWVASRILMPQQAGGIYIQRFNATDGLVWAQPVVVNPDSLGAAESALALSMNQESADGCIIAYRRESGTGHPASLRLQKISPEGAILWSDSGISVCVSAGATYEYFSPGILSDGAGGAIVAWQHILDDTNPSYVRSIRVVKMLGNGTFDWSGSCGIQVSLDTLCHSQPAISSLDPSHALIVWSNSENGVAGIKGQVLDIATGSLLLPPAGVSLTRGLNDELGDLASIPLINGRTAILWEDDREWLYNGPTRIYFKILDSLGQSDQAVNGDSLTSHENGMTIYQSLWSTCTDAAGGFYAVYEDYRSNNMSMRAAHVNVNGQSVGDPTGQLILQLGPTYHYPSVVYSTGDSQSGMYLTWELDDTIHLARFDSLLSPTWPAPERVPSEGRNSLPFGLAANTDGSCFVGWYDGTYYDSLDVHLAKYLPNGQCAWTRALTEVMLISESTLSPKLVSDNEDGVYVCWLELTQSEDYFDLYAQHVTSDSVCRWGEGGMLVAQSIPGNYMVYPNPLPAVDAHNNLVLVWRQQDPDHSYEIRALKLSPSGQQLWGDPVYVCLSDSTIYRNPSVISDGSDGIFVVWARAMHGTRTYVQHLDACGNVPNDPFWIPLDGRLISSSTHLQSSPNAVGDGSGDVVVSWIQAPHNVYHTAYSIRAQRLTLEQTTSAKPRASVPRRFALDPAFPNPFNPLAVIRFELAVRGMVELKVYDVLGREVATLVNQPMEAGEHSVRFDAANLASGVYFYRLKARNFTQTRKMVLLR